MARLADGHLSEQEIEWLVLADSSARAAGRATWNEAWRHLASCAHCLERFRASEKTYQFLNGLRSHEAVRQPGCPDEDEIMRLSAGLLGPSAADELLRHAAVCDYCGMLLRRYNDDFADALTPEEERRLAALPGARPGWQRRFACRLTRASHRQHLETSPARRVEWPGWAWAAMAAGLALAVLLGAWWYREVANSAQRLLAAAYAQQRTMEFRFAGAQYGPLKQERGSADISPFNRPPALLQAETLIGRNLSASPGAPEWLQAKARVDLLGWHYEAAIRSLRHALQAEPDSLPLWIDLASAYFERAEAMDRAIDYGTAIDLLGKVLADQPDNPTALFNRAIAYERMFLFHQAVADWEHYLKVDHTGEWATEARGRLSALQRKTARHDTADTSDDPAIFLRIAGSTVALDRQQVDSRIEDYLDAAMRRWLPQAFPPEPQPGDTASAAVPRRALAVLSSLLASRHGDLWLSDLLRPSPSTSFAAALNHLSRSVSLNAEGNPADAEHESELAEELFRSVSSTAGALRARLETIYALHRSFKGNACLAASAALTRDLGERPYAWVRAQLLIERSICREMLGDFGHAKADIDDALVSSRLAGFGTLELRSLGIAAALDRACGNLLMAWSRNRNGLSRYWEGVFPSMRAYQFHMNLESSAEDLGQYHLALGVARESVLSAAAAPNRSIEAMARFLLANIARLTNSTAEAEAQLSRASRLFAALPQNSVTSVYRLRGEIGLAELQTQRGDLSSPLTSLIGLRRQVAELTNLPLALAFYVSLGTLYRRRGDADEAQDAFRTATSLIEEGRQSLRSPQERLLWMRQGGAAYRELVGIRVQEAGNAEKTLQLWESYRAERPVREATGDSGSSRMPWSPGGFRAALPDLATETILSYAQTTDGFAVWAVDNRGVSSAWVPVPAASLDRLARQFGEQCADATSPLRVLERDGNQLYRWLIRPVEARLEQGRTLIIESDGAISRVPFQAMVDDAGRYLGERNPIIWSPGVWLDGSGRPQQDRSMPDRALVIGPPALEGETAAAFPPLPDAMNEARAVASHFSNAILLAGKQATLEAVERELPAAQVFHFAGHGFSNASGSGLILAASKGGPQPAVLDAARIRPTQFRHCRLAVLAACSTGTGAADEPMDPESLASSFLRAGVPTVVAARWTIDSAATTTLMREFYAALLAEQPPGTALQRAASGLRRDPQTRHPYYWAAFSAFGSRSAWK